MNAMPSAPPTRRQDLHGGVFANAAAATLVLSAAFPIRLRYSFLVFGSFTLLDIGLVATGLAVALRMLATQRPLRTGEGTVAWLLMIPFLICVLSLGWTEDPTTTLRQIGIFAEAAAAYWLVVNVFGVQFGVAVGVAVTPGVGVGVTPPAPHTIETTVR